MPSEPVLSNEVWQISFNLVRRFLSKCIFRMFAHRKSDIVRSETSDGRHCARVIGKSIQVRLCSCKALDDYFQIANYRIFGDAGTRRSGIWGGDGKRSSSPQSNHQFSVRVFKSGNLTQALCFPWLGHQQAGLRFHLRWAIVGCRGDGHDKRRSALRADQTFSLPRSPCDSILSQSQSVSK